MNVGGARLAALALVSTAAMALAACEEHAYPSAAPREGTAAPAPEESALAGAPTTRSPQYAPPIGSPSYPPSQGEAPPPPPPGYGRLPPGAQPPVIISMAPIPNPPEEPRRLGRRHRHRIHARLEAYGAPGFHRRHAHRHTASSWVFHPYGAAHPHHHAHAATPHAAATTPKAPVAVAPAPHGAVAPQLPKPQPVRHHRRHHGSDVATAAAASGGPTNAATASANTSASNTATSSTEADRYQALQQAMSKLFAQEGQLQAPAHMEANQPVVVTLTLPADFAASVQAEAAKDGLSQAAASMNLTAALSGDGFSIVPGDPQSQPLTRDMVTMFEWKVTPQGASHGPLKTSVKAQPVGDSHTLDLGVKSTSTGAATGRLVGVGLLVVLGLGVLGWALQRRRPKVASGARPRTTHTNGTPTT